MTKEGTLVELARALREDEDARRARWDERWDRLAAGTLSAVDEAELAAMARTDPEARAAYEAFRPLGEGFQNRVVAAIREQAAEGSRSAPAVPAKGRLLSFPPPRRLWLGFGGLIAAGTAAAAVVLLVRPAAPLPEYSFEVASGTREFRADTAGEPVTFLPGDLLRIDARPDTEVVGGRNLAAEALLVRGGSLLPVALRAEAGEGGALRLRGALPGDLAPGAWRLWIVVGRPGKLPEPASLQALSPDTRHRDRFWVAEPRDLEVLPPPP